MVVFLFQCEQLIGNGFQSGGALGLHKLWTPPVGQIAAHHMPIEYVFVVEQLIGSVFADHKYRGGVWKGCKIGEREKKRVSLVELLQIHVCVCTSFGWRELHYEFLKTFIQFIFIKIQISHFFSYAYNSWLWRFISTTTSEMQSLAGHRICEVIFWQRQYTFLSVA
jgi:hypothetical protein